MSFHHRLNGILPRLTSDDFLESRGLGNEIAFYIFDYPPEEELQVRDHIQFVMEQIRVLKPGVRVRHVNLFDLILDYLEGRKILEMSYKKQFQEGDEALMKAIAGGLHESRLATVFHDAAQPEDHDLVLVSGVGNVWPLLRTHTLLNNLHQHMGNTPLVMFFPGRYDGQSLRLFGKIEDDNYYRAFKLVP